MISSYNIFHIPVIWYINYKISNGPRLQIQQRRYVIGIVLNVFVALIYLAA
jgi:hypothetical protein